jgi:hypothetical protein
VHQRYGTRVSPDAGDAGPLAYLDDDGNEVLLDSEEARTFLALTRSLEGATVSACPGCAARVLACVAVVDLLDAAPPHPRARDLHELADEAPTLHLYVVDLASRCRHGAWRDPGYAEWREAIADVVDDARGPR